MGDLVALGAAVRDARRARGWTQAELAERARVSRRFVIALERASSSRAELGRVLAVLRTLGKDLVLRERREGGGDLGDLLDEVLGW